MTSTSTKLRSFFGEPGQVSPRLRMAHVSPARAAASPAAVPASAAVEDEDKDLSELPVENLKGTALEYSAIVKEARAPATPASMPLLRPRIQGGPREIRNHLFKVAGEHAP